jgi:hypothetical protein
MSMQRRAGWVPLCAFLGLRLMFAAPDTRAGNASETEPAGAPAGV